MHVHTILHRHDGWQLKWMQGFVPGGTCDFIVDRDLFVIISDLPLQPRCRVEVQMHAMPFQSWFITDTRVEH